MAAVWINQILQGVLLGGLYTLFATGLSLSAGVMRFVNIAHGDFIVLACFALLLLTTMLGLNPVVATLVVLPIAFAFGFGLQRFLLQRVVGENVLLVILVTFALSIIIENGLLEGFGADPQKISGGWMETATIALGPRHQRGRVSGRHLRRRRDPGRGARPAALPHRHRRQDPRRVGRCRRRRSHRPVLGANLCDRDGHLLRDHRHRRRLHVDLDQFRSGLRADPASDRLRGHRAWRARQPVGFARRRHRAWRRAIDRRPIRHRLADAWPAISCSSSCWRCGRKACFRNTDHGRDDRSLSSMAPGWPSLSRSRRWRRHRSCSARPTSCC